MAKIDGDLVYLRSENARLSLKALSQHLHKTPQRLKYALSVLQKDGLLRDPYCLFDYSYFGLILFRVYFKGGYTNEQDKNKLLEELKKNLFITSIYELTGEFDLAVEITAPNPSKFNKELKKIATLLNLNDYKIILNLVSYVYPRHYLTSRPDLHSLQTEKIIGGDREKESFKEPEMKVIKNLLLKPTLRFTELARQSDLNIKTVKSVYRNLSKRNLIKGFKYVLDTNKMGLNRFRLFLKFHNISLERENQLIQLMKEVDEIIQVNKTVGDWDMEVDIESPEKSRVRQLIMKIREDFKDLIERFNLIEFYTYHQRSYLPLYLFKEEEK